MRKIISLLLAIAMVMSMSAVAFAAEATFTDLEDGQYYVPAVEWAVEKGITTGVSATEFAPHATCTRGQVVTFLYRAAGEPEVAEGTTNPFTDVAKDAYYYNAVLWAVAEGITTGMTETTFGPDGECKREHVVTFQYRAAGEPTPAAAAAFTDVTENDYFADAVAWAVEEGVTTGATETTFNPAGACERAHVVTFLYRSFVPGAVNNPIIPDALTSIEVAAGDKVYYGIHGRLSGQILTIVADEDEDVTVIVEGKEVEPVDGVYTAELTGAPTTSVVVINNGEKDADLIVEINYAVGTESNPIIVTMAGDLTSVAADAEGETYYQISSDLNCMFLTVVETEGLTVTLNDEELVADEEGIITAELTGTPVNKLVVSNDTDAAVETPAAIEAAKGTMNNPFQINSADDMSAVNVAAGEKVYYAISSRLNGQGLFLNVEVVDGLSVSINGVKAEANEDGYFVIALDVDSAVMQVIVTNASEEVVEAAAYIKTAPGTESNPIFIDPSNIEDAFLVPAGETVYYQGRLAGTTMSYYDMYGTEVEFEGEKYVAGMTGSVTVPFPASEEFPVPVYVFSVTSTGEEDAYWYPTFAAPGSMDMPAELTIGENTATCAAGGNGYFYTWTAAEAGTLTLIMPSDSDWMFVINNLTASKYGDNQFSDAEPIVNSVEVAAGDEINIMVNTYDPEDMWNNPAGDIVFTASFVAAEAAE